MPRQGPGRPRTRPAALAADKAYSSRGTRAMLRSRGRHRRNRGAVGGRPVTYDRQAYRGRKVVERAPNEFKQWRGLATRYDKLALIFRGAAVLRSILLWLDA